MTLSNAITATPESRRPALSLSTVTLARIARPERRERDFGVGYGNSSGYASNRRYVRDWGNARFRIA